MSIRVVVADDQAIARQGLRMILESEPDIEVVGEAVDGLDALGQVDRREPDVVLMDIRMPRMDGLEATRRLRDVAGVEVIVITTFDLDEYVFDALRAGAAGFLVKDSAPELIIDAVRAVARGDALIAPEVTRRLLDQFVSAVPARAGDPALDSLSPRERDVLLGIAAGRTNAEIAAHLQLEESTVKSHVGRMLAKLDLSSRVQAVIYAYETGLIAPGPRPKAASGGSPARSPGRTGARGPCRRRSRTCSPGAGRKCGGTRAMKRCSSAARSSSASSMSPVSTDDAGASQVQQHVGAEHLAQHDRQLEHVVAGSAGRLQRLRADADDHVAAMRRPPRQPHALAAEQRRRPRRRDPRSRFIAGEPMKPGHEHVRRAARRAAAACRPARGARRA